MVCESCGEKPKDTAKDFTKAVIEINNPETLVLFRKVVIPASMGDDTTYPPKVGLYRNVLVVYEANNRVYLYSSDGIPTAIEAGVPQEILEAIAELQEEKQDKLTAGENISIIDNIISSTGSSMFRLLTEDDYNYDYNNTGSYNTLIIEKLEPGSYELSPDLYYFVGSYRQKSIVNGRRFVIVIGSSYINETLKEYATLWIVDQPYYDNTMFLQYTMCNPEPGHAPYNVKQVHVLASNDLIDRLDYQYSGLYALDAHQGMVLRDRIDGRVNVMPGTPTSDTVGTIGQLMEDVASGKLYICTGITTEGDVTTYTWESPEGTTYSDFVGATASTAGESGLVPAPASGETNKYLKSDGTWANVSAPTVGDGTLTIQRNSVTVGTFNANATANSSVNINVPTAPSDIGAQPLVNSANKISADYVDDTNTTNKFVTTADLTTLSTALQPADINKSVLTDVDVSSTVSTSTVNLNITEENLMTSASSTSTLSLPVASSTEAGVMNSATFDAVTSNSNNINALLNGAVAVTGLPASPSQSDITTAWQTETGLTTLINRASLYDVTNQKVWTYYSNDTTWYAASNTTQVVVNQATNTSLGIVKGSTTTGQVFAENDGTLSVNGWDNLTGDVSAATSKLATIANGAEVNVQSNWNETNSASDAYIQNKPTIPTVNNGTLTIQKNGVPIGSFTANASSNTTADITVPTKTSDLTNDGADNTSTYVEADELATVATSGSYSDLSNKPTIPAAQIQSDWTQANTSAKDYIKNKPTLAMVAVTGNYNDLSNTPTIPTVNDATLTIQQNGVTAAVFSANASSDAMANIIAPVITMTTTDPGEGSALAANNFVAVYGNSPLNFDYSTSEVDTGTTWIDGSAIYKKTINFGTLPNAGSKVVPHGITNLNRVLSISGYAYHPTNQVTYPLPFSSKDSASYNIGTTADQTNVEVGTGIDRSYLTECYITLYYTKSSS